jgi:hypothetical protein
MTYEDFKISNMAEARKFVGEVEDEGVRRALELGLDALIVAVFVSTVDRKVPSPFFDALLFVQLNYVLLSRKNELIAVLNGDLTAVDESW